LLEELKQLRDLRLDLAEFDDDVLTHGVASWRVLHAPLGRRAGM
jgi:hypothetical protein